jgi:hypothetical protein
MLIAVSVNTMRPLKDLLSLGGAACIGWAVPNLVASLLPFFSLNDVIFYGLLVIVGITLFTIGYGFHRRAIFAWWLGCLFYLALVAYFCWRGVVRLELTSYYVVIFLIGHGPFAALWWRYAKLYFADEDDG